MHPTETNFNHKRLHGDGDGEWSSLGADTGRDLEGLWAPVTASIFNQVGGLGVLTLSNFTELFMTGALLCMTSHSNKTLH